MTVYQVLILCINMKNILLTKKYYLFRSCSQVLRHRSIRIAWEHKHVLFYLENYNFVGTLNHDLFGFVIFQHYLAPLSKFTILDLA